MEGARLRVGHNDQAGLEAGLASFHDLSLREGVVDGSRLAELRAQNTHDAVCSPQEWEDNMEARGDYYSQGDTAGAEIPREIW
jgi:hypothetical protein